MATAFFKFLHNLKDACAALDRIVKMKNQMRSVFQNNVTGKFRLQRGTMRLQFIEYARAGCLAENAYEHMRALQVGRDIDSVDTDKDIFEVYLARNDSTQLAFDEFVYP